MQFKPQTEKEIADARLWAAGPYSFEIIGSIEKPSKKGNQMIELRVKLFGPGGSARVITDYLLEKRMEKLLHAAQACGLLAKYKTGSLPGSEFQGKKGRLKLGVEKGKNGYRDKNIVVDYLSEGTR